MKFYRVLIYTLFTAIGILSAIVIPSKTVVAPAIGQSFGDVSRDRAEERLVARVNPDRPIQIKVVNAGDAPITCILTQPPSGERIVPPGDGTSFGSVNANYLPLPINFLAYPQKTLVGLNSTVFAENNVVTIVIGAQLSDASGDIAVNIDADGSVYLY